MISQISLTITVVLFIGSVGVSCQDPPGCWTNWFNDDSPIGTGDYETLSRLRERHPAEICEHPMGIEAATTTGIPAQSSGQRLSVFSKEEGLICLNRDQVSGSCFDYKVRFECLCPPQHCLSDC